MMQDAGFEEEVRFAAREDVFQVVPKLDGGRVRLLA
jgi:phosphosulfolactate phosphohydrolase-like enzyme